MWMKNYSDIIGNWIHDILTWSTVPQPTAPLCAPAFISSPVNHIFNKSLLSGIFPSHLKYSIIKLLFKKGDMNNRTNYRPVLLLTSFSRVLENYITSASCKCQHYIS
jgi:hypothetical protein